MTTLDGFHDAYGATYGTRGERAVVEHYGRPERTGRAVRNGVGVYPRPTDVLAITGADRVDYLDNVLSTRVPAAPGEGCYGLLLTPTGRVRLDMYVYTDSDRVIVVLPPGEREDLVAEWQEKVFIQDVSFDSRPELTVIHVTGPEAPQALTPVTSGDLPSMPYACCTSTIGDVSVFVAAVDAPAGEHSFELLVDADDAATVLSELTTGGVPAIPFGTQTWEQLTLEAGTPLLDPDFRDEIPNNAGLRAAIDFEKGCFVGQEVVSRIEHRGQPNVRLVGLEFDDRPEPEAELVNHGESVGRVTRAVPSPMLDTPIGFGYVPADFHEEALALEDGTSARIVTLPFVEGSDRSARLPAYGD